MGTFQGVDYDISTTHHDFSSDEVNAVSNIMAKETASSITCMVHINIEYNSTVNHISIQLLGLKNMVTF